MTVLGTNLRFYLSGGATNTDPAASLGGARSSTQVGASVAQLFADVTSTQAAAGLTDYRCVYFRNEDADANGLIAPATWIFQPTGNAEDAVAIGLDAAGKNGTAATIATETDAPTGVTFSAPLTFASGLALPSAPYVQNDDIALWVRRTVTAGASPTAADMVVIRVQGDTS